MFIAKFQEVTSIKFKSDKNANMPFIGEVLSGKASGTIINGTMFKREGLLANKAYLCQNAEEEYNGETQVMTKVISEVSLLELQPLMAQLGKPVLELSVSAGSSEAVE
tara:strand:+ start:344 stop:667 length:324 start_codon:yes stop_codon:yes gene_type:complete